jgi:phosphoribosylglycinamide formyltransferase-1
MKNIVIFASGSGSNAVNIIRHFSGGTKARVVAVFCNKADAPVVEKAKSLSVPVEVFDRDALASDALAAKVCSYYPDLIVLAGFLWKFPENLVDAFPRKIVNIHPALLPKFGGKGMYGMHVHRAVVEKGERETGITIHYVDAHYDQGDVIFQKSVQIDEDDTDQDVAGKVQALEHRYFPEVIEKLLGDGCEGKP